MCGTMREAIGACATTQPATTVAFVVKTMGSDVHWRHPRACILIVSTSHVNTSLVLLPPPPPCPTPSAPVPLACLPR